jgi:hypothetical protein
MTMRTPGSNPKASMDRCRNLRWKGLYLDILHDPETDYSNDSALWCLETNKCVGTDGQVTGHDDCTAARPCYQKL